MKYLLTTTILLLMLVGSAEAATYYVRNDGSTATNCTGLADAAYDGSGTGEACAFNHPNWALELQSQTAGAMTGGDDLVIVNGTYTIGCLGSGSDCRDANYNVTVSGGCDNDFPYECYPNPIPDGSSGDHTTIKGCSTSGCGCTKTGDVITCSSTPPILTAQGRITHGVFNLTNSDYVDIQDVEIRDGGTCGYNNTTMACGSADSDELTGQEGITITGATNISLDGVKIYGFYSYGMYGGSVQNITITDSIISYNSFGGWDLDSCLSDGTCGASGNIVFDNVTMNYNGCVLSGSTYGSIASGGCYSQSQGGYGDALGAHHTGGNWTFTDSNFSYNTSDGVDLLYLNRGSYSGGSFSFIRSRAEGNAGNAIKGPNASYVEDSFLIGNCGYHTGQTFSQSSPTFDYCRSNTGNPIAFEFKSGDNTSPRVYSTTILSNADVGIQTSGTCTTGIDFYASNNILIGGAQYNDDTGIVGGGGGNDLSSIYYDAGTDGNGANCDTDFVETYNLCYGWKEGLNACNGTGSTDATSVPAGLFTGTLLQGPQSSPGYFSSEDYFEELFLGASSAALNYSDETAYASDDALDFNSFDRGASWDNGAFESGTTGGGGGGGSSSGVARSLTGRVSISGRVQ